MKKSFFLLLVAFASILIPSCSGNDEPDFQYPVERDPQVYFDRVMKSDEFKTMSMQAIRDSLQLTNRMLKELTTAELVQFCYNYPYILDYMFFYDPHDPLMEQHVYQGVQLIMSRFNGFEELRRRFDCAKEMLAFYTQPYPQYPYADSDVISEESTQQYYKMRYYQFFSMTLTTGYFDSVFNARYAREVRETALRNIEYAKTLPQHYYSYAVIAEEYVLRSVEAGKGISPLSK